MKRLIATVISVLLSIASALPNTSCAQTKAGESAAPSGEANQLPFDMASSWRMTVRRDGRSQVVQIPEGINRDNTKKFLLNTISTFTKGELVNISAEMIETSRGRVLVLTPETGNKITVLQNKDGNFEGTLTTAKGLILGIQIEKLTAKEISEIAANSAASRTESAIKLPGADVPASCAGLIGGWTGRWPHYGQTWLWVIEIDANCMVKYAHRGGPKFPDASVFKKTQVTKGVLLSPKDDGGVDTFELHGDEVWARHTGPDGNNSTVFSKIPMDVK